MVSIDLGYKDHQLLH